MEGKRGTVKIVIEPFLANKIGFFQRNTIYDGWREQIFRVFAVGFVVFVIALAYRIMQCGIQMKFGENSCVRCSW